VNKLACHLALVLVPLLMAPAPAIAAADTAAPRRFESTGEQRIGGEHVRYRAIVAETFLTDGEGRRTASIVSTTYLRTNAPRGPRPVIFVFNGGPGSSAVWTHLGLVGPRVVNFADEVNPPTAPPFELADNPDSLLDVADLVLLDPPGTGFSRLLPDGKPEQFFGTQADARTTLAFMEAWIREHGRWQSPRFMMGESYGTVRASVVARLTAGGPTTTGSLEALPLNGIIMLGQAVGGANGLLSYADDLPTLAAIAWYHGRTGEQTTLAEHVAEARAFAADVYVRALYAGDRLDEDGRQAVAERLAALIGLPAAYLVEHDLQVATSGFSRELLRDEGRQVGIYDGRFTLALEGAGSDPVADDPAMGQYTPAFVALNNQYMREELGVTLDEGYRAIEFREINMRWDYGAGPGVPADRDATDDLAAAMRRNPALHLFVGSGSYDLATTMGSAEHMAAHANLPRERVVLKEYESGHMPYLGNVTRALLTSDLRDFIQTASTPSGGTEFGGE
jgi:carboxypeptidase C (cathepsin A)